MIDLEKIIRSSREFTLDEFEGIVFDVIEHKSTELYSEKTHIYIQNNLELNQFIQTNFSLNKKLFNSLQKTEIHKLCLITEPWCLDACILLPILRAIEIANSKIAIRIFLRDTNEELMEQFLTNGSKSIPIVFGVDEKYDEVFRWGPRSQKAKAILKSVENENYEIKAKALSEFYRSDLTMDIQDEWIELL